MITLGDVSREVPPGGTTTGDVVYSYEDYKRAHAGGPQPCCRCSQRGHATSCRVCGDLHLHVRKHTSDLSGCCLHLLITSPRHKLGQLL